MVIQSCVGGGPMERLVDHFAATGRSARLDQGVTAETWRANMARSSAARRKARIASLVGYPISAANRARRDQNAILVPTTNPFVLPALMIATRRLHRHRVVPLVYDLVPDVFDVREASRYTWVKGALRALNRWWFRKADGIVFIGPRMAEAASASYGRPRTFAVLETGADPSEFAQPADAVDQTELDIFASSGILVSYVGNMGEVHDTDALAAGLPQVLALDSRLRVVIAASGPGPDTLRAAWHSLPPTVRFERPLDDDQWRRLLIRTDIALVTLKAEAINTSLPSKAFSAMAAGACLVAVAPVGSDLERMVNETGAGLVVAPGDGDALASALDRLACDGPLRSSLQAAALRAAHERYSLESLAERWDQFLAEIDAPQSVSSSERET